MLYPGKIEILQQNNKGAAAARNLALNHIQGKYLFFVDSDDYIDSNGVDKMIDVALKSYYDIIQGGFLRKFSSPPSRYKTLTIRTGTLQRNDLLGFTWGKLINSILFLHYQFPTGYAFEDTLMGDIIYPQAKKIYGLNTICYIYRIHKQQITKQYHKQLKLDALDQIFLPIEFNKIRLSLGFVNDNLYFERALRMGYLNYSRLICFDNKTKQNAFCIYANFLRTNFSKGDFQTKDKKLNILYKACEAGNYSMYKSAIKYL